MYIFYVHIYIVYAVSSSMFKPTPKVDVLNFGDQARSPGWINWAIPIRMDDIAATSKKIAK